MKSMFEVDPNFKLPEGMPQDMQFFDATQPPFELYGVADNAPGVLCRLPEKFVKQCSEGVQQLAYHLAGACVRFTTDASELGVMWTLTDTGNMPHFAASGQSGLELFEETDEGIRQVKNLVPAMNNFHGCKQEQSRTVPLPGGLRHYALYLPLYNGLTRLLLGFAPDAQVLPGRKPAVDGALVFYGSSITQGGCAMKVGSCYPTVLARRLDAPLVNLGFSGNGRGEPEMAQYISTLHMSAFVLDYDHNAYHPEHLMKTHEPFYQIVRKAHPDLPIIMLSKPDFENGSLQENIERRSIVRRTYVRAVAAGDRRVWFVDGQTLFGETDRDMCTVDGAHPTDLGFLRMADAVEPILRHALAGGHNDD